MSTPGLSERQHELVRAFAAAWDASSHTPFDLGSGRPFEHPAWPASISAPERDELRPLVHMVLLVVDRSVAPTLRVFPSSEALALVGDAPDDALTDPDRRLGLILEATVEAFEADPTEPLLFIPGWQAPIVRHPHWPLQPEVVRAHDLQQLEDLGLVATAPDQHTTFWPTVRGRAAVKDAAGLPGATGTRDGGRGRGVTPAALGATVHAPQRAGAPATLDNRYSVP